MIIVKLKVNRQLTADYWKQLAIGTEDDYGNPFRIIKLRWNNNKLHKNTDYAKTRGFEDAILSKDQRTGDIKVSYRRNGSITWQRPAGGVGPYIGEVAVTPYNLEKLASMYGDKLFSIIDQDIDAIVRAKYEQKVKGMSEHTLQFNKNRVRGMHTMAVEKDSNIQNLGEIPLEVEKVNIQEQNRALMQKKQEQDLREAALKDKEQQLNERVADLVGEGIDPVTYSEEYLKGLKYLELLKVAKEQGIKKEPTDKATDLITKILAKQTGSMKEAKEKADSLITESLED